MDFGKAGWLSSLIDDEVARHRAGAAQASLPLTATAMSGRSRARLFLKSSLRASGLLYGTPATLQVEAKGRAPEEVLFLAVVRTFCRIALDIADLTHAPPGDRRAQLSLLFSVWCGDLTLAEELQRSPQSRRLPSRVEALLERRAMSLSGDPVYGLVLHNGAVYADAQLLARQAADLFCQGAFSRKAAQRRLLHSGRQKALLVEVLTALSGVERSPSFPTRRAILRQIEDLQLPPDVDEALRVRVKKSFERRPSLKVIVQGVKSADMRRFTLEQTILASLVDGRRSPRELDFIRDLAAALQFTSADRWGVEVEMAEFYAQNRQVVDVFTVSAAAGVMGEELIDTMQRAVEKNFNRLMQEVRETGELSVLLTKAARGQPLTSEERRRMRAQLIDVAKAIPALAIFAAPGGVLLLIALAKVMPFNLLPSAFQDEREADEAGPDEDEPPTR